MSAVRKAPVQLSAEHATVEIKTENACEKTSQQLHKILPVATFNKQRKRLRQVDAADLPLCLPLLSLHQLLPL